MKPVMMAGRIRFLAEALTVSIFDNKRMVAFRYIIKPNFDSSIEPRKRDLRAARAVHIEPPTVQGGRRVRGAVSAGEAIPVESVRARLIL